MTSGAEFEKRRVERRRDTELPNAQEEVESTHGAPTSEQEESERRKLIHDLRERVKEQTALYDIARILREDRDDPWKVLTAVTERICGGLQFPDKAAARIGHNGIEATSAGFQPSDWTLRVNFTTNDGATGWVEAVYSQPPAQDNNDCFLPEEHRWIESITDLLQSYFNRRIANEELIASEERFHKLFQDIPNVAVQGYQLDGTVLYWNHASEKFYGYSPEEAIGCNLLDLIIPPEMRGEVSAALQRLAEKGEDIPPGELVLMRKDGSRINVYSSHGVVRRVGHPPEIFCIDVDLTEMKDLERQFLRAQRMEGIGTLAGGIAHDINNLLAPIVMGVDLLRKYVHDDRAEDVIKSIERSALRGRDLVKQVLSFARGVEGARVNIDIPCLVREIESIAANTFPKNIHFETDIAADAHPIVGDPTQLNQIFLNLCVNARDAMPDGGRLSISVNNVKIDEQYAAMERDATAGRYVVVEVADQGCGMTQEVMDRAFDPFFTTKEIGKGTGLGLSTVQGIIRSHGGFVNVYSEVGKGSVFKVYLPAAEDSTDKIDSSIRRDTLPRGNGECILVVDDEGSILTITQQTLETFGYRVLIAGDGAQAIGLFAQYRDDIDLVLTDMMMPIMDGPAFVAALRRLSSDCPVIAASGLNANGCVARATQAGVSSFIDKPYSADTLLQAIHDTLREPTVKS